MGLVNLKQHERIHPQEKPYQFYQVRGSDKA
jgi:hypothetical protein